MQCNGREVQNCFCYFFSTASSNKKNFIFTQTLFVNYSICYSYKNVLCKTWINIYNKKKSIFYIFFLKIFSFLYCCLTVFLVTVLCNLSVTIGVHRLWSHRSFKCNRTLKLILMFFYTMAGQVNELPYKNVIKKSDVIPESNFTSLKIMRSKHCIALTRLIEKTNKQ